MGVWLSDSGNWELSRCNQTDPLRKWHSEARDPWANTTPKRYTTIPSSQASKPQLKSTSTMRHIPRSQSKADSQR